MVGIDELLNMLEEKINLLSGRLQKISKENLQLKNEIAQLEKDLESSRTEIKALEHKNKEIKVVSALAGNTQHKRLMKHKLNSLVKELDLCIAEVKKKSI